MGYTNLLSIYSELEQSELKKANDIQQRAVAQKELREASGITNDFLEQVIISLLKKYNLIKIKSDDITKRMNYHSLPFQFFAKQQYLDFLQGPLLDYLHENKIRVIQFGIDKENIEKLKITVPKSFKHKTMTGQVTTKTYLTSWLDSQQNLPEIREFIIFRDPDFVQLSQIST